MKLHQFIIIFIVLAVGFLVGAKYPALLGKVGAG